MQFVVRAFPLIKQTDELLKFAEEMNGARREDMASFYRHYGIKHESWHLQETPSGPWVLCVTQVDNAEEVSAKYAQASEEFHAWFKSQVLSFSGVDPNVTPLGPPTTKIFSWEETAAAAKADAAG